MSSSPAWSHWGTRCVSKPNDVQIHLGRFPTWTVKLENKKQHVKKHIYLVGGWFSPTPLKHMQPSNWKSSSPRFGVKIKNYLKRFFFPPPIWVANPMNPRSLEENLDTDTSDILLKNSTTKMHLQKWFVWKTILFNFGAKKTCLEGRAVSFGEGAIMYIPFNCFVNKSTRLTKEVVENTTKINPHHNPLDHVWV